MMNLVQKIDFFMAATSTFFDEDDGWTTVSFPTGFYLTRRFEVFGGWKCHQICYHSTWYDLD